MGSNFFVLNQNFFVREKNSRFKKKIDPHLLTFGAPSIVYCVSPSLVSKFSLDTLSLLL